MAGPPVAERPDDGTPTDGTVGFDSPALIICEELIGVRIVHTIEASSEAGNNHTTEGKATGQGTPLGRGE